MLEAPIQTVTIDHINTRTAITGEGAVILFLHGWGAKLDVMWPPAEKLAKMGFCVHVLDFPGFGESDLPPTTWGVSDYARWVIAYIDHFAIDRAFLVGHSFGGRVSLVLGAEYPERVQKIALSNSAGIKLPPPWDIRLYYIVRRVTLGLLSLPGLGKLKKQAKAYFRRRFGSEDYLNAGPLTETFKRVISQDLLPYAKRVNAPTLLFWGDQDEATPLQAGKILEKEMPDAGLIVFKGAGHYAYLDDLAQFVHVTSYFFKENTE